MHSPLTSDPCPSCLSRYSLVAKTVLAGLVLVTLGFAQTSGTHNAALPAARLAALSLTSLNFDPLPEPEQAPGGGAPKPASAPPPAARRSTHRDELIGFGVIGGAQLRDWFQTVNSPTATLDDRSGKFMIGLTLRFHFVSPHSRDHESRYMLEFDALRRSFGVQTIGNILGVSYTDKSSGASWEFPVMMKRQFIVAEYVRPFLGAGISFRHVSQDTTLTATSGTPLTQSNSQGNVTLGIPLSAGLDFRAGIFHFSPELRYTLWSADKTFTAVRTSGLFNSNANQVAFIVGFTIN